MPNDTADLTVFFAHLGSTFVKVVHRTLMKLSPGLFLIRENVIIISQCFWHHYLTAEFFILFLSQPIQTLLSFGKSAFSGVI